MSEKSSDQDATTPSTAPLAQWQRPTRYLAAAFMVIGLAMALVALVPVFNLVTLGFTFAFLFYLPIHSLARRFSGRYSLGLVLVYLVVGVILILLLVLGYRLLSHLAIGLSADLREATAGMEASPSGLAGLLQQGAGQVAQWLIKALGSAVSGVVRTIVLVGAALFFSFLLLISLHQGRGALAGWVPAQYNREVTLLLTRIDHTWVGYLTAQVIFGALLALVSLLQYWLMGVPYPLLMAVITGLISLIPSIGGAIASLIVAVPCLLLGSTVFADMSNGVFALLILLINIVITQAIYNFVALPIIGRYVKLPTVAVFVGVLVGGALGGIVLAFLISPLLSTLVTLAGYVLSKILKRDPFSGQEPADPPEVGFFSQLLIAEGE